MTQPMPAPVYSDIELKLGIKSSLPDIKKTLGLLLLLWCVEGPVAKLEYCEENGDVIVLKDTILNELYDEIYKINHNETKGDLSQIISDNSLFTAQIEALIVAFEVIWKIAKITFTSNHTTTDERTGGKRYAKTIYFSSNMDIFDVLISQNRTAYVQTLFNWVGMDVAIDSSAENALIRFLTVSAENAFFKIQNDGKEVIFNLESIYKTLLNNESLDIKDDKEIKGPSRILKSAIKQGIINNLTWSKEKVSAIRIDDIFREYLERQTISHQLVSRNPNINANVARIPNAFDVRPVPEIIKHITDYIKAQGFEYSGDNIENLYLSLKAKPFVILAGISGTGKSKLVKLFAEAIGAQYKMIPVRPDWSDSSDLLGHVNLQSKFIPGEMLEFIKEAKDKPDIPYILCLDEMNLARVEHYFSDVLSIIETRKIIDGHIVSDVIKLGNKDEENEDEEYEFMFPENLYIVGTVNMDETTCPFSKKVLDRANTIEFNEVDLKSVPTKSDAETLPQPNSFLRANYVTLADYGDNPLDNELIKGVCETLENINLVLKANNAHVGYRVRDEIVFYMLNNAESAESGLLEKDNAMDNAIMQKILPRIQGSSRATENMLAGLFCLCLKNGDKPVGKKYSAKDIREQYDNWEKSDYKYPKCAEKIAFMLRRFEEDGFTTYWL